MIDDPVLESELAALFTETAPSRPPEHLLSDIVSTASRRRHRPRWLALIKEPPMRVSSRVAVGSPTARLAAILAASILLAALGAGAALAGASYLAGPGQLIVDPNDASAYPTITEAVAAAEDGDTILVRPGVYAESVTITEDIKIRGEGPRDEVVIEIPTGGPTFPTEFGPKPFGLVIAGSDAEVSDLTVRAPTSEAGADSFQFMGLAIDGGAPHIHDVTSDVSIGLAVWLTGASIGDRCRQRSRWKRHLPGSSSPIDDPSQHRAPPHRRRHGTRGRTAGRARESRGWGEHASGRSVIERNVLRLTDLPDTGSNSEFVGIDIGGDGWILRENESLWLRDSDRRPI